MQTIDKIIGDNIKKYSYKSKVSGEKIRKKINVSKEEFQCMLDGVISISATNLFEISDVLEINWTQLMELPKNVFEINTVKEEIPKVCWTENIFERIKELIKRLCIKILEAL